MAKTAVSEITPDVLVEQYGGLVSSIAHRMIENRETAREAAQEVWYEVLRSLPSFQGRSKFSTWLFTIARRVTLNYARNERRYTSAFVDSFFTMDSDDPFVRYFYQWDPNANTDDLEWLKERCRVCLTGFLHCLDNEARLALVCRDIARLPHREIAGIFNKDEAAVRQWISRSRRRVTHFLEGNCALYHPDGQCRCHLKQPVINANLPEEYQNLRDSVARLNAFQYIDRILPEKNYWEILL